MSNNLLLLILNHSNPANAQLQITVNNSKKDETKHLKMLNLSGQIVLNNSLAPAMYDDSVTISQFSAGLYFITIGNEAEKLIIHLANLND